MPDWTPPWSAHVKWTVTGPVYQPPALGLVVAAPAMVGAVLSSLTVTESVPTLPARSAALPLTSLPAVSVLMVWSAVTVLRSTPEPPISSSLASKCTVASAWFQPAAFALQVTVWVTAGAMLSYFSDTPPFVSELPALSTAKYSTLASALLAANGTLT